MVQFKATTMFFANNNRQKKRERNICLLCSTFSVLLTDKSHYSYGYIYAYILTIEMLLPEIQNTIYNSTCVIVYFQFVLQVLMNWFICEKRGYSKLCSFSPLILLKFSHFVCYRKTFQTLKQWLLCGDNWQEMTVSCLDNDTHQTENVRESIVLVFLR